MDSITGLLDGPRARGAFLLRSSLNPPWSLHIQDQAPLAIVAVVRGEAWFVPDGARSGEPTRLAAGDVAIVSGPDSYIFADTPETPPQVLILPGEVCASPDGLELTEMRTRGVRTWGNSADGRTELLTGTYDIRSEISQRLLAALPGVLVVRDDSWENPLVGFLAAEVVKDEPGQDAVLDRLLDLLLIAVLRTWFSRAEAHAPGWYLAQGDQVVGPALRLLQEYPERQWTVQSLASATGVSRAAFARRFTALVGEPPMTFLTNWRLTLAADLLLEPGATVGSVASQVGYGSPFALSTAFKRNRGLSPTEYRRAA